MHHLLQLFSDPPGVPVIVTDQPAGAPAKPDSPLTLTCRVRPGGHPPAKITWFVAGEAVKTADYAGSTAEVSSRLTFVPDREEEEDDKFEISSSRRQRFRHFAIA
jgi:hypothetical protein